MLRLYCIGGMSQLLACWFASSILTTRACCSVPLEDTEPAAAALCRWFTLTNITCCVGLSRLEALVKRLAQVEDNLLSLKHARLLLLLFYLQGLMYSGVAALPSPATAHAWGSSKPWDTMAKYTLMLGTSQHLLMWNRPKTLLRCNSAGGSSTITRWCNKTQLKQYMQQKLDTQ